MLGRQFSSRTVAVASGVVCAILPRATWAGIEARPYALSIMAAVWLTVLLVYAARRGNASAWLSYGIVLAISILLDVYLVLLFLHPCCFHLCLPAQAERPSTVRHYVGSGGLRCDPVRSRGRQPSASDQLGSNDRASNNRRCDGSTIFGTKPTVRGSVGAGGSGGYPLVAPHTAQRTESDRQLLTLAITWLLIPTALIVIWSTLVHPIYTPRYLTFTAPAMALVLGVCIAAVAFRPWAAAALVGLFALAAAPNYVLAQRGPYAKYGMDYSQVADLITAKAAPGDCLLVNDTVTCSSASSNATC